MPAAAASLVEWRPWGRAAFEEARAAQVPVLLAVGPRWCPGTAAMMRGAYADPRVADLLDERNAARARPLLAWGIRTALTDFAAAERYILAIPRRCLRLRLAALLPVLIGLSTLVLLARSDRWLNPPKPLKMPRRSVYAVLIAALICGRSNRMLALWIGRLRRRVERALCSHS